MTLIISVIIGVIAYIALTQVIRIRSSGRANYLSKLYLSNANIKRGMYDIGIFKISFKLRLDK